MQRDKVTKKLVYAQITYFHYVKKMEILKCVLRQLTFIIVKLGDIQ